MAEVSYPSFLPTPEQSGYARGEQAQFVESNVQAGPPIRQRLTFDTPSTYTLNFRFSFGQSIAFRAWFISQVDYGLKPFNITVLNDGELIEQEVSFTPSGIAQITSTNAETLSYSVEVRGRNIASQYDEQDYADIFALAEMSPDGDWLTSANLFNQIVNEALPEAP